MLGNLICEVNYIYMSIFPEEIERRKADNGDNYLATWCAGGRGNTTNTPEATL